MQALFGTAGTPDEFRENGCKTSLQIPGFLDRYGLDCFEYQCGRGVNISEPTAQAFGQKAREHGVSLSLHSPYYISLSSDKEESRLKSVDYILQSARAAFAMGARRIVVHSGSCAKIPRAEALALAKDTLQRAQAALDEAGLSEIILCPETMGKINQLGDVDEVIALCGVDKRFLPAIDFGHLNARTFGSLRCADDFLAVLDRFSSALGRERMQHFHCHFSQIEWTNGGEKQHLTFDDQTFGPFPAPFIEALVRGGYEPFVICESAGTQARDAKILKDLYEKTLSAQ